LLNLADSHILIHAITVSAISFVLVLYLMPKTINSLISKGKVVKDFHKPETPLVPRPAGPVLLAGIATAEIVLFFLTLNMKVIAILLTTTIGFIIGLIDDKRVMPGSFKPVALLLAAIPLIVFGAYGPHLYLIFGAVFIPLLYIPLILVIVPIVGNTINSIDVLNGVASGFVIICTIPVLISIAIFGNNDTFVASLPLLFGTIAFYRFHRFPSKIFPGDSGTLLIGSMYGAIAIAGSSEVIGVIALLPAVMNSFLFLASVKKIVEHRQVKARPTVLMSDFKLAASKDKEAPTTILRLILAHGPLSEKEIVGQVFRLGIFSSLLAVISIIIQYYFVTGLVPK
jgi:UDP-GlcNAc:undecaprenyl-phosphate/decaprenyl-phosphate GlcNAc-1-phosphate transferase